MVTRLTFSKVVGALDTYSNFESQIVNRYLLEQLSQQSKRRHHATFLRMVFFDHELMIAAGIKEPLLS